MDIRIFASTSNIVRFKIVDKTTGQGKTGLSSSTAGLVIGTIADNEATSTAYTQAGSTIETITTLGTYAAPTATKCRFKEVDSTNHKGLYEFQFADARFAVASSRKLVISVNDGESTILDTDYEIKLVPGDVAAQAPDVRLADAVAHGGTLGSSTATLGISTIVVKNASGPGFSITGSKNGIVVVGGTGWPSVELDAGNNAPGLQINGLNESAIQINGGVGGSGDGVVINGNGGNALTLTSSGVGTADLNLAGSGTIHDGVNNRAVSVFQAQVQTIRTGTAQGGTTNSIKLDASASATNNIYNGALVTLTGGTGAGQTRTILSYNGTTKQATVDRAFQTAPDNTSVFAILATDNPSLNASLQVTANVATVAIRTGTSQAGSTSTTIKLDAGASATNNIYNNDLVTITGGTGLGQTRSIIAYNGTTKVATIGGTWTTTPTNTSTFAIYASTTPSQFSDQGVAQAGTGSTITLASTASAVNSIYVGSIVTILAGTDSGDTAEITGYVGATKVATISGTFAVTPDTTSVYAVIPTASGTQSTGTQDVNVVSINPGVISDTSFTVPSLTTLATGPVGYIYQLWRRFFKKGTLTATQLKTYADDGTTAITTQTVSDDGVTQTMGGAS